jgi:mannosyl-glycoprotein endo-beta-N-acetylglucosaminidase
MDFKINNELEDGTSYDGLPAVASCDLAVRPLGSGSKEIFRLLSQNGDSVQYRVFVSLDGSGKYEELTNGYTNPVDGNSLYTLSPSKVFTAGKYKLFTYVRRANVQGTYTDSNTDYDNYLVTYFNCLSSVTSSSLTSVNSSYTLKQVVDNEYSRQPTYDNGGKWDVASRSMVEYYLNPYNFMDDTGKYQFLNLNYKDNYTADDLNKILSGKGVLDGKGAVFLKAAKDANIDVAYLVSHSLLETGNGTSNLAKGIDVNSVKVYNMFGIGAVDAAAEKGGSETAYKNGWFTVDDAICGGASWIASGYISNIKFMQNTDYKMRWNPDVIWHQYATDVNWASAQSKNIKKIMDNYPGASLVFEIPKYK